MKYVCFDLSKTVFTRLDGLRSSPPPVIKAMASWPEISGSNKVSSPSMDSSDILRLSDPWLRFLWAFLSSSSSSSVLSSSIEGVLNMLGGTRVLLSLSKEWMLLPSVECPLSRLQLLLGTVPDPPTPPLCATSDAEFGAVWWWSADMGSVKTSGSLKRFRSKPLLSLLPTFACRNSVVLVLLSLSNIVLLFNPAAKAGQKKVTWNLHLFFSLYVCVVEVGLVWCVGLCLALHLFLLQQCAAGVYFLLLELEGFCNTLWRRTKTICSWMKRTAKGKAKRKVKSDSQWKKVSGSVRTWMMKAGKTFTFSRFGTKLFTEEGGKSAAKCEEAMVKVWADKGLS